jgi:mono/diheme cytochrome c family protein
MMPGSAARQRFFGPFAVGIFIGLLIALVLGAFLAGPLALLHHAASGIETQYGNAVVNAVTRFAGTAERPNPVPADERTLRQARDSYTGACSQCHGADGKGGGVFGVVTFPPATDLTGATTRGLTDSQIFYIIKNGLGFTSMPAYESKFADTEMWALVDFIRALQRGDTVGLEVPTPSAPQVIFSQVPPGGDATRGAELFTAMGCSGCHQPSGALSINPANDAVARVLREGQPGMPCFSPNLLSDAQIQDIRAYIATFPPSGELGAENEVRALRNKTPPAANPTPAPPRAAANRPCANGVPNAAFGVPTPTTVTPGASPTQP